MVLLWRTLADVKCMAFFVKVKCFPTYFFDNKRVGWHSTSRIVKKWRCVMRVIMHAARTVSVLERIRDETLTRENFGQGVHFRDSRNRPLRAIFSSASRAVKNCIGGASIRALGIQGYIDQHKGAKSKEYCAVMCALADTLGIEGGAYTKIVAVRDHNNTRTYDEMRDLVEKTILRLQPFVKK
jgi:hypothetical protein